MNESDIMSKVNYVGSLRCESQHLRSGQVIISDAPVDNQGKGEAFSPTDLVAAALAKCVLTIIGIKARDLDIDIEGSTASVIKVMTSGPRRIEEIQINFDMKVREATDEQINMMEKAGKSCPVAKSLDESIRQNLKFNWA